MVNLREVIGFYWPAYTGVYQSSFDLHVSRCRRLRTSAKKAGRSLAKHLKPDLTEDRGLAARFSPPF